jgi:hypothetical protein
MKMLDNATAAPIKILLDKGIMYGQEDNERPTSYIILK